MIISASRRTDIPALYSQWFRNRIQAGYCTVPNPFNPKQVARISLLPEDVDAVVFWTRHARPFFHVLPLLDQKGYHYYFLYTITGYGRPVEARTPTLDVAIFTFRQLAQRLNPHKVVWRYDPIIVGPAFPAKEHIKRFNHIARNLEGYTERVIISVLDIYKKTARRLGKIYRWGEELSSLPTADSELPELLQHIAQIAQRHGMEIEACAQKQDYRGLGIGKSKCVDDRLLTRIFSGKWESKKDPGQRDQCRCIPSKDIGMVDTCTFGCAYCYATISDETGRKRFRAHDANSPSLYGYFEP